MKRILFITFLCLAVTTTKVYGQEPAANQGAETVTAEEPSLEEGYTFPTIKPEGWISAGYRFVGLNGSGLAEPYSYLHDSVTTEGGFRLYTYPSRLEIDLDEVNGKDYFGDVGYAYKDLIVFRGIDRTLWENLPNVRLGNGTNTLNPYPYETDAYYSYDSPALQYGEQTSINNATLRFKWPDFPFHVYAEGGWVHKDGDQQQLNVLGAADFNSLIRVSAPRDILTDSKTLTVGANSHLGPVEVDFSHGEKRFSVSSDPVLYDSYSSAQDFDPTARAAGVYPHNEIPDLKGSTNTIKLHTSYTGSIVGSATFTTIDNKNSNSGAKADYFVGGGEITWMAQPRLTFLLKYRHKEADLDNPSSVTITDVTNAANSYTYQVRPSICSITDTISGTVRYRLLPKTSLKADYQLQYIRRENAELWNIPDTTSQQTITVSSDTRISKDLTLRTRYTHQDVDNPATNIQPNHSDEGRISIAWTPLPKISTLVSYTADKETRDQQTFNGDGASGVEITQEGGVTQADTRNVDRERLLAAITFVVAKDVSVSASYSYMRNKIHQDVNYENDITYVNDQLDSYVPYGDSAHAYSLGLNYVPLNDLTLNASVSYTISSDEFYPASPGLTQPVSVASFSALDIRETDCSLSGEYRIKDGFAIGLRYRYSNIRNENDNPNGYVQDGTANTIMLTASKRW
ncbi:MAG: hypothetical protein ABSA46_14780 [Thermodesulfovibrionales bacterium]|jgi:hypothetical protein